MSRPRTLNGVNDWVSSAYAAHGRELYRFALRSLGDPGMAEEAVQTTYLRAWRAADRFDESIGSLRTWLFAIVRNVVVDMARAQRIRPALPPRQHDNGIDLREPEIGDEVDRLLAAWQVEEALRRVSHDHRTAIVEVYYRARSYEEVAIECGVPVGTIKSRVYYGLKALRLALEEIGWSFDE